MCTLVLFRNVHPVWPLVIAANRDEFFARPSAPPSLISQEPPIFGGQDLKAGGTWLGVTPTGFFAGLTNQRLNAELTEAPRSRGELVLEVLKCGDVASAMVWLQAQDPSEFNAFNLVFGDCAEVVVAYGRDNWRFESVPEGVSVLPNDVIDSEKFPKVRRAKEFGQRLPEDGSDFLEGLQVMLGDTLCPDTFPESNSPLGRSLERQLHALCVVTPNYGTRSSTIVALQSGRVARYVHAEGPPHQTSFEEYVIPRLEKT